MTGIDRVEAAYLSQLLCEDTPVFGVIRTSLGYVLLDRKGMQAFQDRILGKTKWGPPDLLSRMLPRPSASRKAIESDLRRLSIRRATRKGLSRMLARALPQGFIWLNVGHTNLKQQVFEAIHRIKNARAHVMIHDMIPLLYPQFQRPGTVDLFKRRMQNIARNADLVIYNSHQSRRDAEKYFTEWGRVPKSLVAHLGIENPIPDSAKIPTGITLTKPYFVTTGTIEPRKNHSLLLDVWQQLEADGPSPQLIIIGNRGWNNEAVFKRLDAKPTGIIELNGLSDAAMAAIIQNAQAALFPSLAEGFGLGPCEAIMLGTPIVTSDLAVTREILGNIPIYANAMDMYSWVQIIRELIVKTTAEQSEKEKAETISSLPTWQGHFNMILNML